MARGRWSTSSSSSPAPADGAGDDRSPTARADDAPRTVDRRTCPVDGCGQTRSQGHPPRGWVMIRGRWSDNHQIESRWYDSWACVSYAAIAEELHPAEVAR